MAKKHSKVNHRFAGAICTARLSYGMTQQEVADYLDCSKRWYQRIESGSSSPNLEDTIYLMAMFHIDAADIAKEVGMNVPLLTH